MERRRGKKRFRWQERIGDRRGAGRTGLTFIRRISRTHLDRPLAGLPGFIVAALPLALVVGLAWNFPGFWQVPAVVVGGGVLGVLILRMNWSARVKTAVAFAVIATTALAFAASGTDFSLLVFAMIVLSLAVSLLRARALERDRRERDAWRRK